MGTFLLDSGPTDDSPHPPDRPPSRLPRGGSMVGRGHRCLGILAAGMILLGGAASLAQAQATDTEPAYIPGAEGSEGTVNGVSSIFNGTVTVTIPGDGVRTGPTDNMGKYRIPIPAGTKGMVDVNITKPGTADTDTGSVQVSTLNPPAVTTTTAVAISPGSTATFGGTSFALTGHFSTLDTGVDYNPGSTTFGNISGSILASDFLITGTNSGQTLGLALDGDQPFAINMASVWAAPDFVGQSVSFSDPISGTATFDGNSTTFNGTVTGTDTFLDQATDQVSFTYHLTTSFGSIDGSIAGTGIETLNVVPEPSSGLLLASGLLGLVVWRAIHRA